MKEDKLVRCPICNSDKAKSLLNLNCGNLDDSVLYRTVKINACEKCGHIYNGLSLDEMDGLRKYYNEEYAPINIGATYKTGNMPGGDDLFASKRYNQLYSFISSHLTSNSRILDVGCAMGGFLDFLYKEGLNNLSGIDLTKDFVNYASQKGKYNIKLGNAESIPFDNSSFDVLIINQVIEHLVEPPKAFREAGRVLVDGGILYIGVPDALRYDETCSFDFYWFIMREHLQHFDIEHLKLLAQMEGFELLGFSKNENLILSEELALPNLNAIFRLKGKKNRIDITTNCFNLEKRIEKYIANGIKKMSEKRTIINGLITSRKSIYVWGIGAEFLYMYESIGLKNCNIVGMIDANPYKQKKFTFSGKKIKDKSILEKATPNSVLIISAIAYTKQIRDTLSKMSYPGQIIEV
jgi:SAM-dependent methyltransferase